MNRFFVLLVLLTTNTGQFFPQRVNGFQNTEPIKHTEITTRADLLKPESWERGSAELVILGGAGSPLAISHIDARVAQYRLPIQKEMIPLGIVAAPTTKQTYLVRGYQTLYVLDGTDLFALVVDAGFVNLTRSYVTIETPLEGSMAAVSALLSLADDRTLAEKDLEQALIDLRVSGVPYQLFTANSDEQPEKPTVTSVSGASGILALDLSSPGGKYKGTFWIDLAAQRLVRASVDGKEVYRSGM